jgi:hypothetical protein
MGRDSHPAEGDDSLDGLPDGQVPGDRLSDAVPEDMARSGGHLDRRDDHEVPPHRGLGPSDPIDGIVVRHREPCEAAPPRVGYQFRGSDP